MISRALNRNLKLKIYKSLIRPVCDGLIIRSEESYRMWRVVVCDQETSQARRLKPTRWAVKYNPHKYNPQWGL